MPARGNVSAIFFFFNDTATTEIYTLSLHDALPILADRDDVSALVDHDAGPLAGRTQRYVAADRKSTRLNSSHDQISYAVFCLKKKNDTDTAHHDGVHHADDLHRDVGALLPPRHVLL